MSFFEEVEAIRIAQQHAERVAKLEKAEAKKLIGLYRKVRHDLRDRLDVMPADDKGRFTAQQMRGVLLQVEYAIAAMDQILKTQMGPAAEKLATQGVEDLESEIKAFNSHFTGAIVPIDLDTVLVGLDTKNFLINQYEVSIANYSQGVRQVLTQQITRSAVEKVSLATLTQRMSKFFMGEEWKLLRIARTELHNIYNLGKLNAMNDTKEKYIPDLKKALFHPMDHRTADDSKQLAVIDPVVPLDKPFKYVYRRKRKDGKVIREERTFMHPPERPNDRAIMIPYRDEWDKPQKQAMNA